MNRSTEPQVFVVGKTMPMVPELRKYLAFRDLPMWLSMWLDRNHSLDDRIEAGALLTEVFGRICYGSWEPGYNRNVALVRSDTRIYIDNLLKQKHGSVLEHTMYNFIFANVSRVFTHELVTHRAGTAKSQESFRFVQLPHVDVWEPDDEAGPLEGVEEVESAINMFIAKNNKKLDRTTRFELKKKITSKIRRWVPMGQATDIAWSCNLRELRHVITARTHPSAEAEMRFVFDRVARLMIDYEPMVFQDFSEVGGQWRPEYEKV